MGRAGGPAPLVAPLLWGGRCRLLVCLAMPPLKKAGLKVGWQSHRCGALAPRVGGVQCQPMRPARAAFTAALA